MMSLGPFSRRSCVAWSMASSLLAVGGAASGQDVLVESEAAARARSGTTTELPSPPGTASYTGTADWRAVPSWRQTSFFGARAEGTFFVFVVDCSGSMADADRWLRVRQELRTTLRALEFPQRYLVIFYNDRAWPMPGGVPLSAGRRSTNQTLGWIARILPEGPTDPRDAMRLALGLKPSAVFLLSDGEYPEGVDAAIARSNLASTPIHCIDLSGGASGGVLERIARESGGQYALRP